MPTSPLLLLPLAAVLLLLSLCGLVEAECDREYYVDGVDYPELRSGPFVRDGDAEVWVLSEPPTQTQYFLYLSPDRASWHIGMAMDNTQLLAQFKTKAEEQMCPPLMKGWVGLHPPPKTILGFSFGQQTEARNLDKMILKGPSLEEADVDDQTTNTDAKKQTSTNTDAKTTKARADTTNTDAKTTNTRADTTNTVAQATNTYDTTTNTGAKTINTVAEATNTDDTTTNTNTDAGTTNTDDGTNKSDGQNDPPSLQQKWPRWVKPAVCGSIVLVCIGLFGWWQKRQAQEAEARALREQREAEEYEMATRPAESIFGTSQVMADLSEPFSA